MQEYIFYPPKSVEHIDKALYFGGVLLESKNWLQQVARELEPAMEQGVALFLPRKPFGADSYHASLGLRMKWNQAYLAKAGDKGIVALWIPKQSVFYPRGNGEESMIEKPNFAYNALVELQEAYIRHRHYDMPLVVGIDPLSPHFLAQKDRFKHFCPDVEIHDNLEHTCEQAVELAYKL